jgi:hypothetical protein
VERKLRKAAAGAASFLPVDYDRAYDALDVMSGIAETHNVTVG